MKANTDVSYGSISKALHWFIAITAIIMLLGVFYIDLIPKSMKGTFFFFHKATGVLILFLMLFRLSWSIENQKTTLPKAMPCIEKLLARGMQHLLIFFMILMPLSGWIMATAAGRNPTFYGLFNMPLPFIPQSKELATQMSSLHEIIAWTLLALLSLHILGALKHHFINKDNVLKAML